MKYFTLKELCKSSTADKLGINNQCALEQARRLAALVNNVLDPLREAWGKPVCINSGYRCPELNKRVGGAANSQHVEGEAADITAGSKEENKKLFDLALSLNLPFDQLIDEKGFSWVHISHRKDDNRKQVLHLK